MKHILIATLSIFILFNLVIVSGCKKKSTKAYNTNSKIHFRQEKGKWQLYLNEKPYFIKGAHGYIKPEWVQELGGNSLLVYESEVSDSLLDKATSLNLTVSISLQIEKFYNNENNYKNPQFIKEQRDRIEATVRKYSRHPAVLFWIVGNELHIQRRLNLSYWNEVNEISKMIHRIDTVHPTTTTIAAYPTATYQPLQLKLATPDIDFWSLTIYEFAPRIGRELDNFLWGCEKPILVTEWGGKPYWDCELTDWNAILEPSSTQNAQNFTHNYYLIFKENETQMIGGYVFYWGTKQERTHTSFSLLPENKFKSQATEQLKYIWSGKNPINYCPRIDTIFIENSQSAKSNFLAPDSLYNVHIKAHDPDKDSIWMRWEVRLEGEYYGKTGGAHEASTQIVIQSDSIFLFQNSFSIQTPDQAQQLRLFVYLYDRNQNIATANIPFMTIK